jgi:hypothetical protein
MVGFTTSLGFGRKLERIVRDPHVALAYHARDHGFSASSWYVLAQGLASVDITPSRERLEALIPQAQRYLGEVKRGPIWDRLLREYYTERVFIDIAVRPGGGSSPVLAGRLPDAPGEIALGGRELRVLHKRIGDHITARTARGSRALHIVGQTVVSPDITNEQVPLGSGGVMTLSGAAALTSEHLIRNVFPVQLRRPADHAAIARLKQQFPGAVLPAVAPPEIRSLREVSGLPVALALLLTLLAAGTVAHTLVTSVRRRRRELAILKTVGFMARQVRATVAWQATAVAGASLAVGLPLGIAAGRLAWSFFAGQVAIEPVPVVSPLVLLAIPAIIVLANAVAAFPARSAARTQPATVLRAE